HCAQASSWRRPWIFARSHVAPPSVLTSTRWTALPVPLQERPVNCCWTPTGKFEPAFGAIARSNALLITWFVSGGESGGYVGPNIRCWVLFHSEKSGVAETSIDPTHLMFAIPTQVGTIARIGNPWSGGSSSPFISYARIVSSSIAFATDIGRRTCPAS